MARGDTAHRSESPTFLDALILKQIDAVAEGLRTPHSRELAGTAKQLLLSDVSRAATDDEEGKESG